ncbi:MAG: hypothetical protein SPJ83_01940 [Helicobacter sp.]|nr:hypothetical protein [Helicobacter sp.]MDY5821548.1 hypothetical protein [Helicobacter sp.]
MRVSAIASRALKITHKHDFYFFSVREVAKPRKDCPAKKIKIYPLTKEIF